MKKILGAFLFTFSIVAQADDSKLSHFLPGRFGWEKFQLVGFHETENGQPTTYYRFAKVGERNDEILKASGRVFKWQSAEVDIRGYGASGIAYSVQRDAENTPTYGHLTAVKHQSRRTTDIELVGLTDKGDYLRRMKIEDNADFDKNPETKNVTFDQVFEAGEKAIKESIAKKANLPLEKLKLNLFLYSGGTDVVRKAYTGEKPTYVVFTQTEVVNGQPQTVKYVPLEDGSFELDEGLQVVVSGYYFASTEHEAASDAGQDVGFSALLKLTYGDDAGVHLESFTPFKLDTPSKKTIKEIIEKVKAAKNVTLTPAEIAAPVNRDHIVPAAQADEQP